MAPFQGLDFYFVWITDYADYTDCTDFSWSESGQPRLVEFSGLKDFQDFGWKAIFLVCATVKSMSLVLLATNFCLNRDSYDLYDLHDFGWNATPFARGCTASLLYCAPSGLGWKATVFARGCTTSLVYFALSGLGFFLVWITDYADYTDCTDFSLSESGQPQLVEFSGLKACHSR